MSKINTITRILKYKQLARLRNTLPGLLSPRSLMRHLCLFVFYKFWRVAEKETVQCCFTSLLLSGVFLHMHIYSSTTVIHTYEHISPFLKQERKTLTKEKLKNVPPFLTRLEVYDINIIFFLDFRKKNSALWDEIASLEFVRNKLATPPPIHNIYKYKSCNYIIVFNRGVFTFEANKYHNKPCINGKLIYSAFRWCINLNCEKMTLKTYIRVIYIS